MLKKLKTCKICKKPIDDEIELKEYNSQDFHYFCFLKNYHKLVFGIEDETKNN